MMSPTGMSLGKSIAPFTLDEDLSWMKNHVALKPSSASGLIHFRIALKLFISPQFEWIIYLFGELKDHTHYSVLYAGTIFSLSFCVKRDERWGSWKFTKNDLHLLKGVKRPTVCPWHNEIRYNLKLETYLHSIKHLKGGRRDGIW